MTLKKTAFTAHIERARTHIQQRARIRLKPYPLSDTILFYRTSVLFPLNSKKLSPVCSSLPQFVLVCPNAAQSQKCPRIHGVISGSRFFGSSGSFSWVTLGHGKLRAATYGHMDVIFQGRARQRSLYKHSPSSYDGSPIFDLYSSIRSSEQSMPAASKTIFSVSIFTEVELPGLK